MHFIRISSHDIRTLAKCRLTIHPWTGSSSTQKPRNPQHPPQPIPPRIRKPIHPRTPFPSISHAVIHHHHHHPWFVPPHRENHHPPSPPPHPYPCAFHHPNSPPRPPSPKHPPSPSPFSSS
ncbi:hypothetical protein BU23DRAFT_16059 [Bimuria novae-zelandiae CBS 107.79]|uniref:Uncharacterized protein n=1 Tax=Bimuria novae-zelandiae CBS 107.79 TaxID=1447943 RepID=A0A6A5VPX6_9PLEO|nr:hypothetical protein BU23DRAFT_16059 [Bimuria novae-zelandiae CBS 107.79]